VSIAVIREATGAFVKKLNATIAAKIPIAGIPTALPINREKVPANSTLRRTLFVFTVLVVFG
jgi:hypothetical protein